MKSSSVSSFTLFSPLINETPLTPPPKKHTQDKLRVYEQARKNPGALIATTAEDGDKEREVLLPSEWL